MGGKKWTSECHAYFRTRLNQTPLLKPTWTCCPSWSGQLSPNQSSAWTSSRMTRKRSKLPVAHSGSVLVPEASQAGSLTLMGFRACSSLNGCLLSGCHVKLQVCRFVCHFTWFKAHISICVILLLGSHKQRQHCTRIIRCDVDWIQNAVSEASEWLHYISFISGTTDKVSVHRFGGLNFVFNFINVFAWQTTATTMVPIYYIAKCTWWNWGVLCSVVVPTNIYYSVWKAVSLHIHLLFCLGMQHPFNPLKKWSHK